MKKPLRSRLLPIAIILGCSALVVSPSQVGAAGAAGAAEAGESRIVAVGDIHGELAGFSALLQAAELVDEEGAWSGGDTTLVQLGDFLDRGPGVRGAMDLLRRLQDEAAEAGGEVVVLVGNHEGMNVVGAMRDVSQEAVGTFADENSEDLRRRGLEAWEEWLLARARWRNESAPAIGDEERREWLEDHPPGWIEYRQAVGPEGEYGRWLRELPVAVVRGDTLFMHAGLSGEWSDVPPEEIDERHHEAFEASDRTFAALVERGLAPFWADREAIYETLVDLRAALDRNRRTAPVPPGVFDDLAEGFDGARWTNEEDSPLWFRGYARLSDDALAIHVDDVLRKQGVERLVVGHSPSKSRQVVRRADGRVFLIDTGMLTEHYGGRASALVLEGDDVSVVYGDREADSRGASVDGDVDGDGVPEDEQAEDGEADGGAEAPPERIFRDRNGEPLPFENDADILAFLRHAEIVESKPLAVGVTGARRMVLERAGYELRAVFHDVDEKKLGPTRLVGAKGTMHFLDSYRSQIAAFELARLMGFRTVPPTVSRTIGTTRGSLQLWIEGATSWGEILESGGAITARQQWQLDDMWVFDNLIGNTDRNQGNMLFDADGNLWWIDHTRALAADDQLPAPERVRRVSRKLWTALRELDPEAVRTALADHLSRFEIKALLTRRDRVVRLIEERLAAEGESRVLFDLAAPPPAVKIGFEPID